MRWIGQNSDLKHSFETYIVWGSTVSSPSRVCGLGTMYRARAWVQCSLPPESPSRRPWVAIVLNWMKEFTDLLQFFVVLVKFGSGYAS